MRRVTQALWALYTILAVSLLGCALLSYRAEQTGYVIFFTAGAVSAAMAICHTSWLLGELRAAGDELHRATHTAGRITTRQDVTVHQALAEECCEHWWTSAGAEHDPEHCTRKDAGA